MAFTLFRMLRSLTLAYRRREFFDAAFYLDMYPDVVRAKLDPRNHYETFGIREGRFPNAWRLLQASSKKGNRVGSFLLVHSGSRWLLSRTVFDSRFYGDFYPDVVGAGADPLTHFLQYGMAEGRFPNRHFVAAVRACHVLSRVLSWSFRPNNLSMTGLASRFVTHPRRTAERLPNRRFVAAVRARHVLSRVLSWSFRPNNLSMTGLASNYVTHPRRTVGGFASHMHARSRARMSIAGFPPPGRGMVTWSDSTRDDLFVFAKTNTARMCALAILMWRRALRRAGINAFAGVFTVVRVDRDRKRWLYLKRIAAAELCIFLDPPVAGQSLPSIERRQPTPGVWLATVRNATVFGAFQVCVGNSFVQYEPAADAGYNFVAGQWPFAITVSKSPGKILAFSIYRARDKLQEGVLISGRCSPNYFHFLIEYLAKAYVCERSPELAGVPLIVDGGMFPQQREALKVLFPDRELIYFDKQSRLDVARLHLPSIGTFLPDTLDEPLWKGAVLRREPLQYLRDKVFSHFDIPEQRTAETRRRIYLTRRTGRTIHNGDEVESAMLGAGFEIVDCGTLNFEQQVRLFASADLIVGGLGAAFSNVIFCMPGARVLGLCSPLAIRFPMFASLTEFAGGRYLVVPGLQEGYRPGDEDKPDFHLFHGSFAVDVAGLLETIASPERDPLHQATNSLAIGAANSQ